MKSELPFMLELKTPSHKSSVDPKLLQLTYFLQNNQKQRAPEEFSPVLNELTERFGLLIAGEEIVILKELRKQVVELLHSGHPT